ncbi:MAG TPA: hypothetical protein VGL11_04480 [Candidatus Binatia bacterium]|jgi:pimeloyl-ACP methyl ester carboxylesterase
MKTVVGIFTNLPAAKEAVQELQSRGVSSHNINLLVPGASAHELRKVPTTEGEQPGIGEAVGAVVGTGVGTVLGMAAAATFLAGVGPVVAVGVAAAALAGAAGAAAGSALENALTEGLPKDEWFVYEDALRQGRTIVAVLTDSDAQAELAESVLSRHGAESIDAAREHWWIGLRSAEAERYAATGRDFKSAEPHFRRGFEAALHPEARGRSYDVALGHLWKKYPREYSEKTFHEGYERGQEYWKEISARRAA